MSRRPPPCSCLPPLLPRTLTGNPNGLGLSDWPAYTAHGDVIMMSTPDGKAVAGPDPWKARLDVTAAKADKR